MTDLSTYNRRELRAVERTVWKRLRRQLAGGLKYGIDWPTLTLLLPRTARVLRQIHRHQDRLKKENK